MPSKLSITKERTAELVAEFGANEHDTGTQYQRCLENAMYPLRLPCSVVVADQRADPLHDAICRQINEGLQLIIYAKHKYIFLRKIRQNSVQRRYEQRRQRGI